MTSIISVRGLTHQYSPGTPFEKTAIKDINLDISKGEFIGLIGHTGSGKSTFIQHLNGLLKPTEGQIFFNGNDILSTKQILREVRFKVGIVFQYPEYQLFEETVYKDIAFGPRNMKLAEDEISERIHESARFVGVPKEMLEKSPLEISGGQKRRVAIAGVIAMRPEVLILDEPTAGLDPEGREGILANITNYRKSTGATVILVTHDMGEVAKIADRLIVFDNSRVVMDGPPEEVFKKARELRAMGLSVPGTSLIAERLRELGIELPGPVHTMEHMLKSLTDYREVGRKKC